MKPIYLCSNILKIKINESQGDRKGHPYSIDATIYQRFADILFFTTKRVTL
jgi:hypothetical protein